MKKLFTVLLGLITLICATGLVACGGNGGGQHYHVYGREERINEIEATCDEDGGYDIVVYCAECGEEMDRIHETTHQLSHDWGEWEETTPVTCTENGEETRVCNRNSAHTETRVIRATGHIPSEPVIENLVEAKCESDGSYDEVVYCSVCGEEISRYYRYLYPKNHVFGEENVIVAPTCVSYGKSEFTCTVCGKTKTETTSFLGHDYQNGVCTRCEKKDVPATEGIAYEKNWDGNGYKVTGYEGSEKNVIIADIYDGLPVMEIYMNAFSGNTTIESLVIPDSVTMIEDSFFGCSSLKEVYIGSGLKTVVSVSFRYCNVLSKIYYSGTPSDWAKIGSIENITRFVADTTEYYFNGEKLETITIENIDKVNEYAFYGMNITEVVIGNGVDEICEYAFSNCADLTTVTIGDSVKLIESHAFEDDGYLSVLAIGGGVKEFEGLSFNKCTALSQIIYTGTVTEWATQIFGGGNVLDEGGTLYIGGDALPETLVLDGITEINDGAFTCAGVTSVIFGDSVQKIGKYAFSECESLSAIVFGSGIREIDGYAFNGCNSLTELHIPQSLEKVGEYAFYNYFRIKKVYYAGSVSAWASKIDGVGNITSGGVKELYCNGSLVTAVSLSNITEIKAGAFKGMSFITSVTLPVGLKRIGTGAFAQTNISEITLPYGLEEIGNAAFSGCTNLYEVVIPDSVTEIGDDAFSGCDSLAKVTLGKGLTKISWMCFYGCGSLSWMVIPSTVKTISTNSFTYCNNLNKIYFDGTAEEWESVEIYMDGFPFDYTTVYFYSETMPENSGNFWHYLFGKPTAW